MWRSILYVSIFGPTNPPYPGLFLIYNPMPDNGVGLWDSTSCESIKGTKKTIILNHKFRKRFSK